jgi:hypothetical protein
MTNNNDIQAEQPSTPKPALKALEVMVGRWGLKGRDFTTNEEISGQSRFEWMEGGFFLVHRFNLRYAGRRFTGVEYIWYVEESAHLKTHVFSTQDPVPLEYT